MTGNRTKRMLHLLRLLAERPTITARELSERLTISRRTLFADLRHLRQQKFAIGYHRRSDIVRLKVEAHQPPLLEEILEAVRQLHKQVCTGTTPDPELIQQLLRLVNRLVRLAQKLHAA
ncbi:MAG: hypothetical protein HJJLKODD_00011 [Phycisphaerae bacterium]|nr:hypothetical protein [Phycisphaerae bacterium]